MFGSTKLEEALNFAGMEPLKSLCDKSWKAWDIIRLVHCNINLHQINSTFHQLFELSHQTIYYRRDTKQLNSSKKKNNPLGILPSKSFPAKSKCSRLERFLKLFGISPIRFTSFIHKSLNFFKWPDSTGIEEIIEQIFKKIKVLRKNQFGLNYWEKRKNMFRERKVMFENRDFVWLMWKCD